MTPEQAKFIRSVLGSYASAEDVQRTFDVLASRARLTLTVRTICDAWSFVQDATLGD